MGGQDDAIPLQAVEPNDTYVNAYNANYNIVNKIK